jgi:hypothetical protein
VRAHVERVVIEVDVDDVNAGEDGFVYRRHAVTTDGRRIDDREWRMRVFSGTFFDNRGLSADERSTEKRAQTEESLRRHHTSAPPRHLDPLLAVLDAAGITTTLEELRAVPLDIRFTDAAEGRVQREAAEPPPRISAEALARLDEALAEDDDA